MQTRSLKYLLGWALPRKTLLQLMTPGVFLRKKNIELLSMWKRQNNLEHTDGDFQSDLRPQCLIYDSAANEHPNASLVGIFQRWCIWTLGVIACSPCFIPQDCSRLQIFLDNLRPVNVLHGIPFYVEVIAFSSILALIHMFLVVLAFGVGAWRNCANKCMDHSLSPVKSVQMGTDMFVKPDRKRDCANHQYCS